MTGRGETTRWEKSNKRERTVNTQHRRVRTASELEKHLKQRAAHAQHTARLMAPHKMPTEMQIARAVSGRKPVTLPKLRFMGD